MMRIGIWREDWCNPTDAMTFEGIARGNVSVEMIGTRPHETGAYNLPVRFVGKNSWSWIDDYDVIDVADIHYGWCQEVLHRHGRVFCTSWDNLPFGKAKGDSGQMLTNAVMVIARSEMIRQMLLLEGVVPDKIVVVNPGVDIRRFAPVPFANRDLSVLWAGRITPTDEKGLQDTLFALSLLGMAGVDVRLVVAGSGDATPFVALASKLDVRIETAGSVSHDLMHRLFQHCRVFVFPSIPKLHTDPWSAWVEQWGMSLVEAMACGCPVVASYTGAVFDEIVVHSYNGLLFPPRSYHVLAKHLGMLFDSDDLCKELGGRARQTVEQVWDSAKVGDILYDVYTS